MNFGAIGAGRRKQAQEVYRIIAENVWIDQGKPAAFNLEILVFRNLDQAAWA